jgi:hypothetical protein
MTDVRPELPVEVRRRAGDLMASSTTLHWDDAVAQATSEAQAEAERTREARARAAELSASYQSMSGCPLPGCEHSKSGPTGLCERHSPAWWLVEAEAAADERLADGSTVRDWMLEQRRAAGR